MGNSLLPPVWQGIPSLGHKEGEGKTSLGSRPWPLLCPQFTCSSLSRSRTPTPQTDLVSGRGCYALFIGPGPRGWSRRSGPRARTAAPLARLLLGEVSLAVGLAFGHQARIESLPGLRGLGSASCTGPARRAAPLLLQPRV